MNIELIGDTGLFERRRAIFSPCQRYRYLLESVWDVCAGIVTFVMLNPSKASHIEVDPTNIRCRGFVERWGMDCASSICSLGAQPTGAT